MVDVDPQALQAQYEAMGLSVEKAKEKVQAFIEKAKTIGEVTFDKVTTSMSAYGSAVFKNVLNMDALKSGTTATDGAFQGLSKSLGTILTLTTKFDAFKNIEVAGGHAVEGMGDQFETLVQRFGSWEKASAKLAGAGFTNIASMTAKGAQEFLNAASSGQQLENTYINLQAATGKMGTIFDGNNLSIDKLNEQVAEYGAHLNNTVGYTNENIKVVSAFSAKLGLVPNVLAATIDTGHGADFALKGLAATMTLARGAGRSLEEANSAMQVAYDKLGNSQGKVTDNAQKGVNMFSLMSAASQKLGLNFKDTEGFLDAVADQFKRVGDNTQGATNILARFSGALQNTGVTAKQSVSIVQEMVESIGKLEMGTKALISARSGGPGGLQGAFKVENLLREGKTDQVAAMLEKSFKQQAGGKIYTQKEAEQSPQAAAQFMRQREMLKSGAFGSMAKDNDSATRLLEAMAAGPTETANTIKSAMEESHSILDKGNSLQQTQVNVLNMINNSLDRSITVQTQMLLGTARAAIGTGGAAGAAWKQELEDFRGRSQINDLNPADSNEYRQREMAGLDAVGSGKGVTNMLDMVGETAKDLKGTVSKITDDFTKTVKQSKDTKSVETEQARTARMAARAQQETPRVGAHAFQRAMSRPQATLQVPKQTEAMKHMVSVAPLEINVNVGAQAGVPVQVTTNQPDSTRVSSRVAANGGVNDALHPQR
jgi:hypothetical protein